MDALRNLQGRWRVASLEVDGAALPASSFQGAEVELVGSRFVSRGMGADYEGVFSIDDTTAPLQFSLAFDRGPEAGAVNRGICEIGEETWRMCLNIRGGPAPSGFATAHGDGCALQSLVRLR
jgi:uncharacterized protein (TIGR03067 family)